MPRILMYREGLIHMVDDRETVASEAVPARRRRAARVHDLEIDADVARKRLRVASRVNEETAIVASHIEVLAPQCLGFDTCEVLHRPSAHGGVFPSPIDGHDLLRASAPVSRRSDLVVFGWGNR